MSADSYKQQCNELFAKLPPNLQVGVIHIMTGMLQSLKRKAAREVGASSDSRAE